MRNGIVVLFALMCAVTSAAAQVSVGVWLPGVSIGINMPVYPTLVLVPGYPVYYAPQLNSNYFFYDGMYWVYQGDSWYASSWYNGPWVLVAPDVAPVYILRVPLRYYRQPPVYFRAWSPSAPPRWGQHWGAAWEQRRRGWDNWNRSAVPPAAPLPVYQRQYAGDRYPHVEQQPVLQSQHYRYKPRDPVVQQHYHAHRRIGSPRRKTRHSEPLHRHRATNRCKKEAETLRDLSPPRPLLSREGRLLSVRANSRRKGQPSVSRHQGRKAKTKERKARGPRRSQSRARERGSRHSPSQRLRALPLVAPGAAQRPEVQTFAAWMRK